MNEIQMSRGLVDLAEVRLEIPAVSELIHILLRKNKVIKIGNYNYVLSRNWNGIIFKCSDKSFLYYCMIRCDIV